MFKIGLMKKEINVQEKEKLALYCTNTAVVRRRTLRSQEADEEDDEAGRFCC